MSASLPYCEPGLRSGGWRKMRVNRTQDFVIGGYAQINVLACPWHLLKKKVELPTEVNEMFRIVDET